MHCLANRHPINITAASPNMPVHVLSSNRPSLYLAASMTDMVDQTRGLDTYGFPGPGIVAAQANHMLVGCPGGGGPIISRGG